MSNYRLYNFKTKVKTTSACEKLINFLKQKNGTSSERERVLQALSAFWLPLALIESGSSEKEIALHGLSAIQRLKEQITHLSLVLSLEVPTYSHVFAASLITESTIPPSNSIGNRAQVRREESVKPYTQTEEVETDYHEETMDLAGSDSDHLETSTLPTNINQFDKVFGLK